MLPSILIVDDERNAREGLRLALEENYRVTLATSSEEAFNLMAVQDFDIVLTDLRMPGKSGLTVIDRALSLPSRPSVIMMTAYGNVDVAVQAMKRGAADFLTKPINIERLENVIMQTLKKRSSELKAENPETLKERNVKAGKLEQAFLGMVGESGALHHVMERVKLAAPSKATILITGESGTGKELVAQSVHHLSGRAKEAFVAVHCAALSESLLESEIFGHERGAFTGASERRIGRFEAANKGTLFLEELGEISMATQVKLLRFLETKTIERVGGVNPIPLDVRLVAATNRNLEQLVREGKFREDLYFRLNVVGIRLPALRERKGDIPVLLRYYIDLFSKENGVPPVKIDPRVLGILESYSWPGNIRELRNFAENTVVMHRGGLLREADLDPKFTLEKIAPQPLPGSGPAALSVEENEKRLLKEALIKAQGNRTRAAELLGISRRTLQRKLQEWPELDVK